MMNRPQMYQKGGLKDEGGEIDEVSGNKVPTGGTKKGVRDDIDARLSAGEWVADEATTRYHGLKTFLGMRDEAMMGMKKMEAMGLMGNADEATLPTDMPFGMADLIIVDVDDNGNEKEIKMADGGIAFNTSGMADNQAGESISLGSLQQDVPMQSDTDRPQVTFDEVMADAKMEFKEYRNAEGQSLMVPFIGGVPLYPIPEGYTLYTGEGEGGIEAPQLPSTGAETISAAVQDDGPDMAAINAYKASGQDDSIDWDSLSDEEFLDKANERNGFGRNLAMGVASLISPLAAIGMGAMLRYEDNRILEMAKARLANLPAGQRAAYEEMIKGYEDRQKGLFGGIINKIINTVGDMLGLTDAQKEKGANANLISHSRNIDTYANPDGQVTQEAIDALNAGMIGVAGSTFTADQYAAANTAIAAYQEDPTSIDKAVYDAAITNMANHIGEELGNFVDPSIMSAVQAGGEDTRIALVNAVYQNLDGVKAQLDEMSDTQKAFLGYDGTNYRDVVDTLREDASQILPVDTPRLDPATEPMGLTETSQAASAARQEAGTAMGMLDTSDSTSMPITRDFATTTTQTTTTPTSTTDFLQTQRNAQVQTLVNAGVDRNLAEATIPAASTSFSTPTQTGLEAMEAPMPTTDVSAPSYATMDMGEAGRGTVDAQTTAAFQPTTTDTEAYTGQAYQYPTEAPKTVSSFSAAQQEQDIGDYAQQVYSQTGNLERADLEAAGYTGTEIKSFMEQKPLVEQQVQTGVGTVGFNQQTAEAFKLKTEDDKKETALMQQPVVSDARKEEMLMSQPVGVGQTVTQVTPSQEIQDKVKPEDIKYDAFGTPIESTEEAAKGTPVADLKLKDIIPEAGVAKETFKDAFARNRAAGAATFTFEGKTYTTETAEEAAAKAAKAEVKVTKGKYDPTANKSLSAGFTDNKLSDAEQASFDAAVDRGDSAVANHFASVNRLRNKQDSYAESGFDPAVGASLGLSTHDMEQAEKYGGSVQTAIDEGRAVSSGFLKPAEVVDDSKSKTKTSSTKSTKSSTSSTKSTKTSTKTTTKSTKSDDGGTKTYSSLAEAAADGKHGQAVNIAGKGVQKVEFADKAYDDKMKKKSDKAKTTTTTKSSSGGGGGGGGGGGSSSSGGGGGGCCFIMLEARYGDGTMDEVVRRYRDEHMTERNRRGYYKVAEVLVPLMRKSRVIKWLVTKTFADPLVSYGKYYYGQNKHGVIYSPIKSLWMKLFDTVGGDTEFIRENGEVV